MLATIFALTFQTVGMIIESSPPVLLVSRSCLSDPRGVDCFDHYLQNVLYLVFAQGCRILCLKVEALLQGVDLRVLAACLRGLRFQG